MNTNKKRGTKGITLVSLVITIIIMLILAGVVTNLAISTEGLFSKAKKASEKWNDSIKQEEIIISELQGAKEVYQNGVNAPRLGTNMIPVYYENGWKKADSTNSGNSWYQYGTTPATRQWANAVTVTEKNREKYIKANTGTAIKEEDIIGMFVWIPRYAYRITAGYHPESTVETPLEGMVEIKFLIGTTDEYDDGIAIRSNRTNAETNGGAYVVHPAFTADTAKGGESKESIGFWVAKFEASSNTTTTALDSNTGDKYGHTSNETDQVTVRPNVTSWRMISAPQIYEVCKKMNAEGNIHGLTSIVNPHMMKNSEWGAIAYLTQSSYGNPQTNDAANETGVWNNSYHNGDEYCTTMTGMVGAARDTGTAIGTANTACDAYNTGNGPKGSTTGNVYGIYDLAGGAWEYVAGYLAVGTNEYATYFKNLAGYEKQEYLGAGRESDEEKNASFKANYAKYGDAIWETTRDDAGAPYRENTTNKWYLSWNNDYSHFLTMTYPFFVRGGGFYRNAFAGVFAFSCVGGGATYIYGFRPVVGV